MWDESGFEQSGERGNTDRERGQSGGHRTEPSLATICSANEVRTSPQSPGLQLEDNDSFELGGRKTQPGKSSVILQ